MIPELEPLPTLATSGEMRGRLMRHLVLLVLATTSAIVGVIVWNASATVEELSGELIGGTADHTEATLRGFFGPIGERLRAARRWGDTIARDTSDVDGLNELFVPVLRTQSQISSMMVADGDGSEYMLLRRSDGWLNRRTFGDERPGWSVLRTSAPDLTPLGSEEQRLEYYPRTRPWYEEALSGDPETVRWTSPYTFFTTQEPGITASIAWQRDGRDHVVGMDVLLRDVSSFTTGLEVRQRGYAVVVDDLDRIVGLPRDERYTDAAAVTRDVLQPAQDLGLPALAEAVAASHESRAAAGVFAFDAGGETWWAGFRPLDLGGGRRLFIGVVVPEADFRQDMDRQRNIILAIAVLALAGAVVLALRLDRAVDARVETAVERAQTLGQYTLLGKIGQGGIGAVYRARHSMLRRPCAVKVLRPQQSQNEVSLARFEREVQATAELSHPNTISIYDYGRTPDGVFYYAMEYLRGISLFQLVKIDGPQPPARVIHIMRQVCGSLAEAHESGLVHRDIKPGNIMLCERGRVRDFVKVLDFGLVKSVGTESDLTQAGALFGTPSYLSPEGIRSPDDVGAPSDIYAVGAVAYFLLAGSVPFTGDSMMAVLTKHIKEAPQRPAERLGRPLPDDLQDVILHCLAKRPEGRPASARELDAMFAACADAQGWTATDASAWWDRHPDLVATPGEPEEDDELSLAVDLRGRGRS